MPAPGPMPLHDALRLAASELPPPATLDELGSLCALLEERTLRAALEASGWIPEAAARRLGRRWGSSLQRALARHPGLLAEIGERRAGRRDANDASRSGA